jgi:lipid-A-disaccharide synthase
MRYYMIAGERSGDLHGGNLARALRKHDPDAIIRGFGGEYMHEAGVELAVRYGELAIMGLVELLLNLNKISKFIRRCKEDIDAFKPDVIILIDYGGFNRRIAKHGREKGIKVFYYIPPKVWAWYQSRAKELKRNVDQMFVILPFEKAFYKKFDWEVNYVGNPVMDAIHAFEPSPNFRQSLGISAGVPLVALLPGSRKQELRGVIPVMEEVARRCASWQFVVAAVDNLDRSLYGGLADLPNVKTVINQTYDLLAVANAAIVTSGTATLETALFKVPQVVVYKANAVTYWLVKMIIQVKHISLVNLIAGREVVQEMIQSRCNPIQVTEELTHLVHESAKRNEVMKGYHEIYTLLDAGGSASENTASLMVKYLKGGK